MKGLSGVTDSGWFAFLSQQLFYPKQFARITADKPTGGGHARHKHGG